MPTRITLQSAGKSILAPAKKRTIIQAQRGETYQLLDESTGKTPETIKTKIRGKSLIIENSADSSTIEFKDYVNQCAPTNSTSATDTPCVVLLEGHSGAPAGLANTATAATEATTAAAESSGMGWKIAGGAVLLGGLAAAAAGGGGGGGGGSTPDTTAPTVAISSNVTQLKLGQTATISFQFSENVQGFTVEDIVVTGGTLSNFAGSGTNYTAIFTPTIGQTVANIKIASNAFIDAANNNNTDGADANNQIELMLDMIAPTIAISANSSTVSGTSSTPIKFTFSEAVNDFTLSDITVTGGALSNLTGSGTNYEATFTPAENQTTASLSVASNAFLDAAGNMNTDGSESDNSLKLLLVHSVKITTTETQLIVTENDSTPDVAIAGENVSSWTLSGEDANLFSIDNSGNIRYALNSNNYSIWRNGLDFESPQDADKDGLYHITVTAKNVDGSSTDSKDFTIAVTDLTESPAWLNSTWLTDIDYGTSNKGVQSLLVNDGIYSSWSGDGKHSPLYSAPKLTYSFQNVGSLYEVDTNEDGIMDGQRAIQDAYSDLAKKFIRSVFAHVSEFCNISFTETTEQNINGADIRLFADTASNLEVDQGTLGFAYQPMGQSSYDFIDRMGNFYLVTDSYGLTDTTHTPFGTTYGQENATITHELGHALGLDHPFMDVAVTEEEMATQGFFGYNSTATGTTTSNSFGESTGGGHDTPLTDTLMETIMSYHNPHETVYEGYFGLTSNMTAPWNFGIYDMAALQHLYGMNTKTRAGNNVYQFDSNTPLYQTLWDGGGTDTIIQTGAAWADINLNEGTLSRVGQLPSWEVHIPYDQTDEGYGKIVSVEVVDPNSGTAVIDADGYGVTFYANTNPNGFNGHFNMNVTMERESHVWHEDYADMFAIEADSYYNLGIAFGVTIENAIGGDGNDAIKGNSAANHITGGKGNDTLTGGTAGDTFIYTDIFGQDTITDFTHGQDVLQFASSMSGAAISFTGNVLDVAGYGSIALQNISSMTAGVDYIFV